MLLTAYKINVNDNFPPAATVPNSEMMLAGICNPTKKTKEQHKTLERIYPTNNALFLSAAHLKWGLQLEKFRFP